MDLQTGLISIGVVVISAAFIFFVSMFGMKEKSYEEAIAEQRKLPDDLLLGKKEKGKEKKHKNKTGKKVKEKKEEKEEKDEKPEHVQFEETPQILPSDLPAQRENLPQPSESPINNKTPKDTPTKSKRNAPKDSTKKKDETNKEENKKESQSVNSTPAIQSTKDITVKETQKDSPKDSPAQQGASVNKESKKQKKKNDILAQIGGDKDGVNVSLLIPLVQKAELSRSEIQILIDQLLNKQLDNPVEHSEWTEGRADPVIKLKKQLAEKDKALAEEHEASINYQNKLKELRAEFNAEKSRLSSHIKQLEEALNNKITEAQTLHTRMQHILESHAAEKQGFSRQIEQLQSKVNEDAAIIHKMQEDQGQTQGHLQQELIAQRKQLEVQYSQMRDNENALKSQLAQKHAEAQDIQNVLLSLRQELQATCESSTAEIEMLRQQLGIMQEQLMHSEGQLQVYKESGNRIADMSHQVEEAHRASAELDHRLKNAHRHEQELQKQLHALKDELKLVKAEAKDATALQSEILKLKNETAEIKNLKSLLNNKDEEVKKKDNDVKTAQIEVKKLDSLLNEKCEELTRVRMDCTKAQDDSKHEHSEFIKVQDELKIVKNKLASVEGELTNAIEYVKTANGELKMAKAELEQQQNGNKISNDIHVKMMKLQEDNERLVEQIGKVAELQKEVKQLRDENDGMKLIIAEKTHENGVEEKAEKHTKAQLEHGNILAQKDKQLGALELELSKKQAEFNQLNAQVESLQNDAKNQHNLSKRLQEDLEVQRSKNNDNSDKVRIAEQESTKSFLQRIFPDIDVEDKSYDNWLKTFEERVSDYLSENKQNDDIAKHNKKLQSLVNHYKEIIADTEGMLNNLQSHVESAESRWQSEMRQKENDIVNLRLELKELQNKSTAADELVEKIKSMELRLAEHEAFRKSIETDNKKSKNDAQSLFIVEQLNEEKGRLMDELQQERNKNESTKTELIKTQAELVKNTDLLEQHSKSVSRLQSEILRLKSEVSGASNNSEQLTGNGPLPADTQNVESTKKATKRRRFTGWFRKKVASRTKLR